MNFGRPSGRPFFYGIGSGRDRVGSGSGRDRVGSGSGRVGIGSGLGAQQPPPYYTYNV